MLRSLRTTLAVAAASAALLFAATPAHAITGGVADGDAHPNVGMIAFYEDGARYRCTATLVTPTILLTAAHCTAGTMGKTIVTFDSVVAMSAPSNMPYAPDTTPPTQLTSSTGYTATGSFTDTVGRTWHAGTAASHPQYSDFTDTKNWNDVGVVVLDEPVTSVTPASIAGLNYLDQYAQPKLNKTLFTIVGYGTEVRKPEAGPQKPTPETFPLLRRVAQAPGQKLTPQILQVNGNINDNRGTGGSCFGDSGGPTFHGGRVVTVTSYGYTDNCRYLDGLQRVDIKVVQDWLATYGVRP